jgi:phosphohistidine phosphatase
MRLLILRHAKSEKAAPGEADRDRGLNSRGRKDSPRIGAYLAHHGLVPDRAIVSSACRTRETFEELATALPHVPAVSFEDRLYNAGRDAILRVIKEVGRPTPTLLVIGHNPGLHACALALIAAGDVEARERLNEGLPTSGLVVIDFAGADWRNLHPHGGRLDRFVTPRLLKTATD